MLWLAIIISFLMSFAAKLLADSFLAERFPVIGSFAGLQYATNSGVAFSITFPGHLQTVFIAIALIAIVWAATKAKTTMSKIAFGLIVGGAFGNVADRLLDGVVTDFFQVGTFPIFNVADSCITIGVSLLLFEAVWQWWKR
ncbi:MAG: signal peptidase II [Candidatus Peribacteraceae bacterium]|nr:signal peptidase II [Candidatus Peribacteraceae bacterium]